MRVKPPSIFTYTEYRRFLQDYYLLQKKYNRRFSHRKMARDLGFTSPNYLKLIIDGKRNIGRESLRKITSGVGLNKQESEYFSYLVFFNQARSAVDKNYFFGLIAHMRSHKNVAKIPADQYEYFGEWYHPAVRELVKGRTDPLDYRLLSRLMGNGVSEAKIRKSVTLLKRLGLLSLDEQWKYRHSSALLNTENEINSFAVRRYHTKVLDIAQDALNEVPPAQREFDQLTVRVSPDMFSKIKGRLQDLRSELLQMIADDRADGSMGIYHLNLQFYPLIKDMAP
jgi:uncharacterized protein (TIGR02147 family)